MSIPFSMVGPPPIPREESSEAIACAQMALAAQNQVTQGLGQLRPGGITWVDPDEFETTMGVDGMLSSRYWNQRAGYQEINPPAPAPPAPVENIDAKPPSELDRFAQLIWDDPP